MSIREKIVGSELYLSGLPFRAATMAKHIGEPGQGKNVAAVLCSLRSKGSLCYENGAFWKSDTHWINKARLNDANGLRREREAMS